MLTRQDSGLTSKLDENNRRYMEFLRFQPIYQERVWGGRALASTLGRTLPENGPIGESWEIVDRPEANSTVAAGARAGTRLRTLIEQDTAAVMGPQWRPEWPFPILVKWLDCRERLSLQVHPPASVAPSLNGEPKTENWYIVEATPDAALLAGLRPGASRAAFESALRANTGLEDMLCRLPVRAGDSLFVPSGRLHAIDAGNLILEIQQNSDTTYRVYDWGRVGLDGKPRQLHIDQSLASIDFDDFEPSLIHPEGPETVLADSHEFRLRHFQLAPGASLEFPANDQPRILSVVEGVLTDNAGASLARGDNVLLPYAGAFRFRAGEAGATCLVTDRFHCAGGAA